MKEKEPDNIVQRVQESYRQLPVVTKTLNDASDKLNASVKRLETFFKKNPIGVASWVNFHASESPDGSHYYKEQVGYAKVDNKWGLAIRTIRGNEIDGDEDVNAWAFNESARGLRVRAVPKLPELLEQLVKDASEMVGEVNEQIKAVDFLSATLEDTAVPAEPPATQVNALKLPIRPMTPKTNGGKP